MVGTPSREKENMAGTPAREKENVAGTPAREKEEGLRLQQRKRIYGGDSHKKRAGIPANVLGCEFDKQT